ncbi:MAG: ATP-binding protein, partial [Chloroflexi bacterium]|nr:ATP-binding protein [Chloroflexota bacterium]
ITDDEVHYGVLDRSTMDHLYSFFYFRDDASTATMVETIPGEYREPPGSENQQKLIDLKQAIYDAGLNPVLYQADWDDKSKRLINLNDFGEKVYHDLLNGIRSDAALQERFIEGIKKNLPDEFAQENAAMEAFIEEHCERYVIGSRKPLLDELIALTKTEGEEGSYTCLVGNPGCGKSALLAYLSRDERLVGDAHTLVIKHFVGASSSSTDVRNTLRKFCHEIKTKCLQIDKIIPEEPEALKNAFNDFLRQASSSNRIVILLDAVNQLDATFYFKQLKWLPERLPRNVHIIFSTIQGPVLEEVRKRFQPLTIKEMSRITVSDGQEIIEQFSRRFHKVITPKQRAALLAKSDAGLPIYLLTALEELRTLSVSQEVVDSQDQDQAVLGLIERLPSTTYELFKWVLGRLQEDDGFRDEQGNRIGTELIPRFAALLCASRYGLSQRELDHLLYPYSCGGNLPALIFLLRPYLMQRGELLDFYHSQLYLAASDLWLHSDPQQKETHLHLANYFRNRAHPDEQKQWVQDARSLSELPYHLANADKKQELQELFTQLAYLAARVRTGQIYEQISDYSYLADPSQATVSTWRAFLQKHAQRLVTHPEMLIALVNHEGFAEARKQIEDIPWNEAWIRTTPEKLPPSEIEESQKLGVQVLKKLEFDWGRVSAIATLPNVAFCFEKLGLMRIYDLKTMRQTEITFAIRRDRPLVITCAPDASSVAIFYESGKAELYQCILSADGLPGEANLTAEFDFYLPESEDPVVVWHAKAFWFQSTEGSLMSISSGPPSVPKQEIDLEQSGELAGLYFNKEFILIALRQGHDTLLVMSKGQTQRLPAAHLTSICPCGENILAAAFTDGKLILYEIGDSIAEKREIQVGLIRGALGWDGLRLIWMGEKNEFCAWDMENASPTLIQDNEEIFPSNLHVVPRQWVRQAEDSMLLAATHRFVSFRMSGGESARNGRLEEVFGGSIWHARIKHDRDHWLASQQPFRQILLQREVMGRLYCAEDGKGQFFTVDSFGNGSRFDLQTLQPEPIKTNMAGFNVNISEGEESGGCWSSDRDGEIHFVDAGGRVSRVTRVDLQDIHGSYLKSCGKYLVWIGYSGKFFPETGLEPARTFIVYKKKMGNPPNLEKIGEQFLHPREGQCASFCYDAPHAKVVSLWAKSVAGADVYCLKTGTIDDLLAWQLEEIEIDGFGLYRHIQSALSRNGAYVGVVNSGGEIKIIAVENGDVAATLAASAPFTAIATGEKGTEFWTVAAYSKIFRCALDGGEV